MSSYLPAEPPWKPHRDLKVTKKFVVTTVPYSRQPRRGLSQPYKGFLADRLAALKFNLNVHTQAHCCISHADSLGPWEKVQGIAEPFSEKPLQRTLNYCSSL